MSENMWWRLPLGGLIALCLIKIVVTLILIIIRLYGVRWVFLFSSRRRHTRCALVTGVQTCALPICDGARFEIDAPPHQRGVIIVGEKRALAADRKIGGEPGAERGVGHLRLDRKSVV